MMLVLYGQARFLFDMRLVVSQVIATIMVVKVYWMVVAHLMFLSMVHAEVILLVER